MADKAEIKAKLVLDDRATKAALEFKDALDAAAASEHKVNQEGDKVGKGGGGLGGFLSGVGGKGAALAAGAGAAAAVAVAKAYSWAKDEAADLANEVMHITEESDEQIRSLTGVLTMLDENKNSYEDVYDRAGDLKNELEDIGIEAGVSADAVTAAFQEIYNRGGKTIEQTEALTESMTEAARIIPGGLGAISAGFNSIELGVIRARNPIVQMIAATGMLEGNAKSVAAQMMKMTPAAQMELAEKAMARMGDKAKAMPLSYAQVTQSLKDIKDNMAEAMGTPVLAHLTEQLSRFQNFVLDHRDVIENTIEDMGETIGGWIDWVGDSLEALEQIGLENSDDLKAIWTDISEAWSEAWVGANLRSDDVRSNMKDVLSDLIKATRVMADLVKDIADAYAKIGPLVAQAAKVTPGLSTYGANMQQAQIRDQLKRGAHEGGAAGLGDAEIEHLRSQYLQDAALSSQDAAEANAQFTAAYAEHGQVVKNVTAAHVAAVEGSAKDFGAAFDWATASHNEAAQKNIAEFVASNENIQQALLASGPDIIHTGAKGLIDALKDIGNGGFADKLKQAWKPNIGVAANSMSVNFNNATINIKQDFKDEDPDRIAVAFKKNIGHQAVARTQSSYASPFGF